MIHRSVDLAGAQRQTLASARMRPGLGARMLSTTMDEPWHSEFSDDYGRFESVADLLRQIGLDESHHKEESLRRVESARFAAPESPRIAS